MLSVNFSKIEFKLINPFLNPGGTTTERANQFILVCFFMDKPNRFHKSIRSE